MDSDRTDFLDNPQIVARPAGLETCDPLQRGGSSRDCHPIAPSYPPEDVHEPTFAVYFSATAGGVTFTMNSRPSARMAWSAARTNLVASPRGSSTQSRRILTRLP